MLPDPPDAIDAEIRAFDMEPSTALAEASMSELIHAFPHNGVTSHVLSNRRDYPLARDGRINLDGIGRINVGRFSECMEALCNYLDGWDSYFADMIQTNNEIQNEAYGEMYGGMEY